jgi:uncharacterized protein YndB with AHSA1/START domain
MTETLEVSFEVACSVEHAFELWTSRIDNWWPADHTVSGSADADVFMQGGVGGRIFERTSEGVEHEWGEITAWEPPSLLGYVWHIGRERSSATEVQIRFVAQGPTSTRIEIEHSGWDRFGSEASEMRDRNQIGWRTVVPHFLNEIAR